MTRRTYEADAEHIETADDLDDLVHDKREGWRANSSKARRRQRRYKKGVVRQILTRLKVPRSHKSMKRRFETTL